MPEETSKLHVSVSKAIEGEVLGALNRAGGVITGLRRLGELSTGIDVTLPRNNVQGFATWLKAFSNGQGQVSEDPQ